MTQAQEWEVRAFLLLICAMVATDWIAWVFALMSMLSFFIAAERLGKERRERLRRTIERTSDGRPSS